MRKNQVLDQLLTIEVSKKYSDRAIDLINHKNHYASIEKKIVFLGDRNKNFTCERCLTSYLTENMLVIHKPKGEKF